MKRVFICSPYRGDETLNTERTIEFCKYAIRKGYLPIAPHLYFTRFLDEYIEEERNHGISMGLDLLRSCDELWAFMPVSGPTEGMQAELSYAVHYGIPVQFARLPSTPRREEKPMTNTITTKEAASILGVSIERVRVLANEGRLGARRLGSIWTFDRKQVEEYKRTRKAGRPWKEKK